MTRPALFSAMLAAVLTLLAAPVGHAQPSELSPTAIVSDFDDWLAWTAGTHPALDEVVDRPMLDHVAGKVRDGIRPGMSRLDIWHEFARLNPVFNDAHTGLTLPALRGERFSMPVRVADGRVFLASGDASAADTELVSVNGHRVAPMLARTLPLIRGESDVLRARILELKFSEFLDLHLGPIDVFELEVRGHDGAVRPYPGSANSQIDGSGETHFELDFHQDWAVLRIDTFDRALEAEFTGFLARAFEEIANVGVTNLIIDIRANGGGARQLSDPLLAYLTAERYTPISAVTARVDASNIDRLPGAELGAVVSLPFAQWVEPAADLEHRFEGDVSVLIGPTTYSQAVVFSTIIQDFGLGQIVGAQTDGRANQSGQVQRHELANTGFQVGAPLYLFTRASGETGTSGVIPDIVLDHSVDAAIEDILPELR